MNDLVERLRYYGFATHGNAGYIREQAADEIERLQARVEQLEGDLNIMRLQRDATHVSRCPKCAATEQGEEER